MSSAEPYEAVGTPLLPADPEVAGEPGGPARPAKTSAGKSTAELTGDLARQVTSLVHHEIELARREIGEKGKRAGLGSGLFGAAGVLALLGVGCLLACAIAALHLVLPVWLSALVVGGVLVIVAGALALVGGGELRRAAPPLPTGAIEHAKEDVAWIRTHARSRTT
jgi:hypothetical protein